MDATTPDGERGSGVGTPGAGGSVTPVTDAHPQWPIARLAGDIDLSNVDDLTLALEQSVANHALGLVVDLTPVTYMDSTGLRLLFRLARRLRDRQQTLHLVVPEGARIRRILELSGVALVASMTSTLPDLDHPPAEAARAEGAANRWLNSR